MKNKSSRISLKLALVHRYNTKQLTLLLTQNTRHIFNLCFVNRKEKPFIKNTKKESSLYTNLFSEISDDEFEFDSLKQPPSKKLCLSNSTTSSSHYLFDDSEDLSFCSLHPKLSIDLDERLVI